MLSNLNYNNVEIVGKGSVYENKSGKQTMGFAFYYIVNGGKKNRKVVTASSKEECLEKATAFLDKLDKEYEEKKKAVSKNSVTANSINVPAPVRVTFKEIGAEWFKEYSSRLNKSDEGLSYSSVDNRDLTFRKICNCIGDMFIDEINQDTAFNIIDWCRYKSDGTEYSFSYMDKLQQTFHMVMKYADKHGLYDYKLKKKSLKNLKKPNTDSRFMDREQISEILELLKDNERYSLVIEFIVASGLRQEELFALKVNDFKVVDENRVEIYINKSIRKMSETEYKIVNDLKTEKSRRTIVIPYSVYDKTMKYYNSIIEKESAKDKEKRIKNGTVGLVFVNKEKEVLNKKTFERNFRDYLKRRLKKVEKELGYETSLHMFRHSFASLMAEEFEVGVVAKLLGDSITTVQDNYYSLSSKVKGSISESSENILRSIKNM